MSDKKNSQGNYQKLWAMFSLLIIAALLLSGCGGSSKPRTYTIGVINLSPALDETVTGFKQGMTELGYVEGENVTYIYAGATGSIDELDGIAQELVKAKVDLILSISTPATLATKKATADNKIPVVFVPLTDPVGAGLVNSLSQPGGNLTGVTFGPQEAQRLAWLTKIAPDVKQVYIIYNPNDNSPQLALKIVTETASKLGIEIIARAADTLEDIDAALADLPEDADAIYILPDSQTEAKLADILAVANAHNLPTSVSNVERVKDGPLYSYAMKQISGGQQAARLADQILKGIKPADLPVETAEFFLAINLKTAQTIGLNISDNILSQAETIYR